MLASFTKSGSADWKCKWVGFVRVRSKALAKREGMRRGHQVVVFPLFTFCFSRFSQGAVSICVSDDLPGGSRFPRQTPVSQNVARQHGHTVQRARVLLPSGLFSVAAHHATSAPGFAPQCGVRAPARATARALHGRTRARLRPPRHCHSLGSSLSPPVVPVRWVRARVSQVCVCVCQPVCCKEKSSSGSPPRYCCCFSPPVTDAWTPESMQCVLRRKHRTKLRP